MTGLRCLKVPSHARRRHCECNTHAAVIASPVCPKGPVKHSAMPVICTLPWIGSQCAMPVEYHRVDSNAGAVSRVNITVYDYAEHIGEALAWTSPSKGGSPIRKKKGALQAPPPVGGQLLYTHLKQAAMFGGDSNSRWCVPSMCAAESLSVCNARWKVSGCSRNRIE